MKTLSRNSNIFNLDKDLQQKAIEQLRSIENKYVKKYCVQRTVPTHDNFGLLRTTPFYQIKINDYG